MLQVAMSENCIRNNVSGLAEMRDGSVLCINADGD